MSWNVKRREILAMGGITATAGCLGDYSITSDGGIVLGNVRVSNATSKSTDIVVKITDDTGVLFQNVVNVEPEGYEIIERGWSDDSAHYTISYAGEGRIEHFELPSDAGNIDGSCIDIDIRQDPDAVEIFFRDDNPPWGDC